MFLRDVGRVLYHVEDYRLSFWIVVLRFLERFAYGCFCDIFVLHLPAGVICFFIVGKFYCRENFKKFKFLLILIILCLIFVVDLFASYVLFSPVAW